MEQKIYEWEIENYENEQKLCDVVDTILKILVDKQVSIEKIRLILDKARETVELSVESAILGEPFVCKPAPNFANTAALHENVKAEVNRRKEQGEVRNKED